MLAKFCDGPLDGVEIEMPKTIDKLVVIDDDGGITRYECDIAEILDEYAAGYAAPDCVMHLTTLPESFDEEVVELLRPPHP